MALNIKNANVDRLARRSAELRRTGLTEALEAALEKDVADLEAARDKRREGFLAKVRGMQAVVAAQSPRDPRDLKEFSDWIQDDNL